MKANTRSQLLSTTGVFTSALTATCCVQVIGFSSAPSYVAKERSQFLSLGYSSVILTAIGLLFIAHAHVQILKRKCAKQ